MTPTIERAQSDDVASVLRLLTRHGLPLDGASDLCETMVVARDARQVIGAAALELYDEGVLLRSVVVDVSAQGQGVGQQLTAAALALATVFLLTTTAAELFPRFGFERINREDGPASVGASVEFQSACPASAIVMRRIVNRS